MWFSIQDFSQFLLILCTGLACGLFYGFIYVFCNKERAMTGGTALCLALLPAAAAAAVCVSGRGQVAALVLCALFFIIAFARETVGLRDRAFLFAAAAAGALTGFGHAGYGLIFTLVTGVLIWWLTRIRWGEDAADMMILKIWIPENLNFQDIFDPVLEKYTRSYRLLMVRTTDFGSLCELRYQILPEKEMDQKQLMDEIRTKNGNMNVVLLLAPEFIEPKL